MPTHLSEHAPVPRDVFVMDTTDDMTILPGTFRVEGQVRCGCTWELRYKYGHETTNHANGSKS